MKKIKSLFFIAGLLASSYYVCVGQATRRMELFDAVALDGKQFVYGSVKEVREYTGAYTDSTALKIWKFDSAGHLVEKQIYLFNKMLSSSFRNIYDEHGRLSKQMKLADGKIETYTYNSHGDIATDNEPGKGNYKYSYRYDVHGRPEIIDCYNQYAPYDYHHDTIVYNNAGNKIQNRQFWSEDHQYIVISYTYNTDGLVAEKTYTNGEPDRIIHYTPEGNYGTDTLFQSQGLLTIRQFMYDTSGNLITLRGTYYPFTNIDATTTETIKPPHIEVKTYTYSFDAKGNWITCVPKTTDNNNIKRSRRIIEYY